MEGVLVELGWMVGRSWLSCVGASDFFDRGAVGVASVVRDAVAKHEKRYGSSGG